LVGQYRQARRASCKTNNRFIDVLELAARTFELPSMLFR